MKIGYVAPFFFPTGYAEAARAHAKALALVGADVVAKLNRPVQPEIANELIVDEAIKVMVARTDHDDCDVWMWHTTPDGMGRVADKTNFGYAVWETQGLPENWSQFINGMDGLLTCSDFSARLFRDGGVEKPIVIVPHPIDVERFKPAIETGSSLRQLFPGVDTLFLTVAQWMPRKGVEDVITAFGAEFEPDERVGLVLLVWRRGHTVKERQACKGAAKQILARLNKPAPKVWLLGDKMPAETLPDLYAASDVIVSASKGEAFSLPVFEAAACGIPTISTGWGGMWDFLTNDMAYRVAYDMETVHNVGGAWRHYSARQKWARPRLDDLRRAMREAHEDKAKRAEKGRLAMEMVRERLCPEVIGKTMLEGLRSLLDSTVPVG